LVKLLLDQLAQVAIQVAPPGDALLKRGEAVLPGLNARLMAQAMFDKEESATGLEHPVDFGQG
jgi:hypothetical protein